jgi:hypothetical protein
MDSLRLGNLHDQKQEREISLEAAVPVPQIAYSETVNLDSD